MGLSAPLYDNQDKLIGKFAGMNKRKSDQALAGLTLLATRAGFPGDLFPEFLPALLICR